MALPAGVSTCEVTIGPGLASLGANGTISGTVRADRKLVWTATGATLYAEPETVPESTAGGSTSFVVPHVDQPGFVDASGASITNWSYRFEGVVLFPGGKRVSIVKPFQALVGQATLDLDLVADGPVTKAVTGPTALQQAATDAAAAAVSATSAASASTAAAASATAAAEDAALADLASTDAATSATLASGYATSALAARAGAETAQTAAEAAATSVQREAAGGVAGLDAGGKLYETRIPTRLSAASLNSAYQGVVGPLDIPTYDGNPSVTHPDVLYFQDGWNGFKWWMAFTPFPDDPRENPSVVASNDGVTWLVPPGLTNPVTPYSELAAGFTYHSDTDLCQLANGDLALYYRATNPSGATEARIYRKTSSNGVTWSSATQVISITPSAALASPAVVREADNTFSMWSINTTTGAHATRWERRTSVDGVTWSAPTTCSVPAIAAGGEPWHVDVMRDRTGYHALLMTNGDARLYYRWSRDGLTWYGSDRVPLPKTGTSYDTVGYYRSTLINSPSHPGRFDVYAPAVTGSGAAAVERIFLHRGIGLVATADVNARLQDEVFIPGAQFAASVGTPAVGNVNGVPTMLLDSATTEQVHAVVGLPTSWTSVRVDALWANAGTGTGDVVLNLKNDLLKSGSALGALGYQGANITATAGAQNIVITTNLIASTPVSAGAAVIRILRRGADAPDTLPNDIGLIGVRLTRTA
jgi:hypothetical protein